MLTFFLFPQVRTKASGEAEFETVYVAGFEHIFEGFGDFELVSELS